MRLRRRHAHKKSVATRRGEAEARNARTKPENTRAYRRRMEADEHRLQQVIDLLPAEAFAIMEECEVFAVAARYSVA